MTTCTHAPGVYTPDSEIKPANTYNLPLARLRAFLVALVVAHHAVLAYFPWLPPPNTSLVAQPRLWQAFPTLDPQRWTGWAFFAGFNDTFFMALLFFLSGVFVWGSLQRKGAGQFLRDRFVRLGVPFIIAAAVLAPLAYYPAFLQTTATPTFAAFWQQWKSLGDWPAGPAWFLWVLLGFGCAAAALFKFAPDSAVIVNRCAAPIFNCPFASFLLLALLSAAAYVPMASAFSPLSWAAWGPFTFQTSRIIHYALYFAIGTVVGADASGQAVLSAESSLAKRWILWPTIALALYAVNTFISATVAGNPAHPHALDIIGNFLFSFTCAAISMACLSLFLRFARSPNPVLDDLCACSFGIYLIHQVRHLRLDTAKLASFLFVVMRQCPGACSGVVYYPIVNWLQHALLVVRFSGFLKGVIVAVAGLALSWLLTHLIRRLAIVPRSSPDFTQSQRAIP